MAKTDTHHNKKEDQGKIKTGSVLKYILLPQVFPRLFALLGSGFGYLSYLLAILFNTARILPNNHPYLMAGNIGRFGLVKVLAEGGRAIEFRRENADQIFIYATVIFGLIIMTMQIVLLGLAIPSSFAFSGVFVPHQLADPSQDIAFQLMDRVFGIPGIFNSCVSSNIPCFGLTPQLTYDTVNVIVTPTIFPWPFHEALHSMFRFYSTGMIAIAFIILIYFIITIAAETAQTGQAFGKRYNTVWAPIRLVMALGLLVPVSYGMNSAQLLILHTAKMGSNFATSGWIRFNQELSSNTAGLFADTEMIARAKAPQIRDLLAFLTMAKVCESVEEQLFNYNDKKRNDYTPAPTSTCPDISQPNVNRNIEPYLVTSPLQTKNFMPYDGTNYDQALDFYSGGDVAIRFGERNQCFYGIQKGNVFPFCGELTLSTQSLYEPGARYIQSEYYDLINDIWNDEALIRIARYYYERIFASPRHPNYGFRRSETGGLNTGVAPITINYDGAIAALDLLFLENGYRNALDAILEDARIEQNIGSSTTGDSSQDRIAVPNQLVSRGWAGAGIWYNRIAQMNGAFQASSRNLPSATKFPFSLQNTVEQRALTSENFDVGDLLKSAQTQDIKNNIVLPREEEERAVKVYTAIMGLYYDDNSAAQAGRSMQPSGNIIMDVINFIFGTEGLFNLRDNQDVHPLASLAAVGKSLIESSIIMLGLGLGGSLTDAGLQLTDMKSLGIAGEIAAGLGFTVATLGLTAGFILFYVLPIMPFVYFFFAVGNWVKGIFEALVGAPLWALAHLRIDGNGIGDAASSGYFLVFEIFLRPILTVFGLLAGVLTFAALANILNEVFDLAVTNVSGGGAGEVNPATGRPTFIESVRGPVDQLFYTVIYAVIMYMMALSSFKLIDLIPNQMLRWMGSSVSSFGDQSQDAAQQLSQYAAIGGGAIFSQGLGGVKGGLEGLKKGAGAAKGMNEDAKAQQQGGG